MALVQLEDHEVEYRTTRDVYRDIVTELAAVECSSAKFNMGCGRCLPCRAKLTLVLEQDVSMTDAVREEYYSC